MPARPPLSYDVFVAPEKPFAAAAPHVGDPPAWDPTTSTLIFGVHDAVLVDALMTVDEATALAAWIALHERRLITVYITHGHGDHHLGLSVILDRFPGARAVASAGTVAQMREQTTPEALDHGARMRCSGCKRWPARSRARSTTPPRRQRWQSRSVRTARLRCNHAQWALSTAQPTQTALPLEARPAVTRACRSWMLDLLLPSLASTHLHSVA